jgi:hypothetical protein
MSLLKDFILKLLFIIILISMAFISCKDKDIFSVRLPKDQVDYITQERIKYNQAVQLRYSPNKTIFFASMENMLDFIKKYNWNLLKAGVKKAYVADYYISDNKKSEMWINLNVAFLAYIKDPKGQKKIIAFNNPKILSKYKDNLIPINWKYTKPMKTQYFTFIELIRELRASKQRGKK